MRLLEIKGKEIKQECFKATLSKNFDSATATYDDCASIQAKSANDLVRFFYKNGGKFISRDHLNICDFGSGTGFVTEALLKAQIFKKTSYTLVDIAPLMLEKAKEKLSKFSPLVHFDYLCFDGEKEQLRKKPFDFIFSNFSIQWFLELELGLSNLMRQTRNLIFAIPIQGSLSEWIALSQKFELNNTLISFASKHEVLRAFEGIKIKSITNRYNKTYKNCFEFLREFKQTGANTTTNNLLINNSFSKELLFKEKLTIHYDVLFVWVTC
jgi:SAM-dependent methyltransferase